jgi:hypothetical protein
MPVASYSGGSYLRRQGRKFEVQSQPKANSIQDTILKKPTTKTGLVEELKW